MMMMLRFYFHLFCQKYSLIITLSGRNILRGIIRSIMCFLTNDGD